MSTILKDYEMSKEYEDVYREISGYDKEVYDNFILFLNNKDYNDYYRQILCEMGYKISKLSDLEKIYLMEILTGNIPLKSKIIEKIIGDPDSYVDESQPYYDLEDMTDSNNREVKEVKNLKYELQLIETDVRMKSDRIRRIHLEFGEKLIRAEEILEEFNRTDKNYSNSFGEWYISLGLNKDFVSQSKKRFKLYLKYKDSPNLGDTYNFFTTLSIKMILQLTKKEVTDKKQEELLIQIYKRKITKSTEIPTALIKDGLLIKNFTFSRALKLMNKINLNKKNLGKDEYEYLMYNYMEMEEVINNSIESLRGKFDNRVYYDMEKIRAEREKMKSEKEKE